MTPTILQGIYENGQITLIEKPKSDHKMNVSVIFYEEENTKNIPKKRRKAGGLGKIWYADDFDAPLEDLKDYM
jgi:Protein of unknown function (DUF2281)